jgi:hypothetical protein
MARLFRDGRKVTMGGLPDAGIAVGWHLLRCKKSGYASIMRIGICLLRKEQALCVLCKNATYQLS